jgi:hypothetical protein
MPPTDQNRSVPRQGGEVGAAYLAAVFLSNLPVDLLDIGSRRLRLEEGAGPLDVDRNRSDLGARLARRLRSLSRIPPRAPSPSFSPSQPARSSPCSRKR